MKKCWLSAFAVLTVLLLASNVCSAAKPARKTVVSGRQIMLPDTVVTTHGGKSVITIEEGVGLRNPKRLINVNE